MSQFVLLVLETLLIAGLLLFLFQLRHRLGLAPLFVTLGSFQVVGVATALSPSQGLFPGGYGPDAAVLVVATLFAVLLVYIGEGPGQARELIFGLLLANLSLGLLLSIFGHDVASLTARDPVWSVRTELFQDLTMIGAGSAFLLVGLVLMVITYGALSRILPRSFFLRVGGSAILVLSLDGLLLAWALSLEHPAVWSGGLLDLPGNLLAAVLLALVFTLHLRLFRGDELETELEVAERRDLFDLFTFREGGDRLPAQAVRDSLTGLFNRGFFDEILPLELARSSRSLLPISLLLLDLDHFKAINDRYGHPEGDRVLKVVGETLLESIREADAACRFGGEEFAVVLPHAAAAAAGQLAGRIQKRLQETVETASPPLAGGRVTVTIGIATYPNEADSAQDLVVLADRRLYRGKEEGRDRIVGGPSTGSMMIRYTHKDRQGG